MPISIYSGRRTAIPMAGSARGLAMRPRSRRSRIISARHAGSVSSGSQIETYGVRCTNETGHKPQGGRMRRLNIPFLLAAGLFHVAAHSLPAAAQAPRPPAVTVFEGARLIIGDGSAPIEDSAFIIKNGRFTT